jgi:hypothetical protein
MLHKCPGYVRLVQRSVSHRTRSQKMTTRVSLELCKTWPPETDSQQLAGNPTAFRPSPSHRIFQSSPSVITSSIQLDRVSVLWQVQEPEEWTSRAHFLPHPRRQASGPRSADESPQSAGAAVGYNIARYMAPSVLMYKAWTQCDTCYRDTSPVNDTDL